MALCRLLSLLCLLAPLTIAQAYSGGDDLLDVTVTKTVTETVTKYLSECGVAPTPFDTTLSGTTTVTSTLQSTVSIIVSSNGTGVSGATLTGLDPSQSDAVFSFSSSSLSLAYTSSAVDSGTCAGFNCSAALTNATTKAPCSTATVVVPATVSTSTTSLSNTYSIHSATPAHSTSSTAVTTMSPTQIPVSRSTALRDGAVMSSFLGFLGIIFMSIAGLL
ncbi:hypothetical protein F4818DRAFT_394652 [Hypoxylon cercidicola]|nr:hypothetical protein F4818DRAFT_394652 [Hypoxylon cercidicola]